MAAAESVKEPGADRADPNFVPKLRLLGLLCPEQ
jgi:hypothetical protein